MTTRPSDRRLSMRTSSGLPASVTTPAYDPRGIRIGIVHIGPGAFHRAHQAVYLDDLLADDPQWGVCAVSLHGTGVRDALRPQDGLYTLALLEEQAPLRVIGAIRELLCAGDEREAVLARLADPAVRLVTLTVTEKGYCLAGDDLDLAHPDVVHDLASPEAPRGTLGYIVAGLRRRRRRGIAPYTVLSCDNLADNGRRLRRAVLQYAQQVDAGLADWIAEHVAFPRSMVDSITPATDDDLRLRVARGLGCADAWPVQRERYAQWVIEDAFCNDRPAFERAGVTLSNDIAGYDLAKLRLLNGAHSTLAYLGALLDIETVSEAMRDPLLAGFVERLMREDIAPALDPPQGLDLSTYIDAILGRFRNPAVRHRLLQIAWDGSQKLPVRLFGTIAEALAAGRRIDRLCLPVAAWMGFVRRQVLRGVPLVDPLAETLASCVRADADKQLIDAQPFLQREGLFSRLGSDSRFVEALQLSCTSLGDASPAAVTAALRRMR